MDCIHCVSRVDVLVRMSTHVDSLMVFNDQLLWALTRFLVLELLILTSVLTVFDNLSEMDWYHLDTSQLMCIHSMWEFCCIVEQL